MILLDSTYPMDGPNSDNGKLWMVWTRTLGNYGWSSDTLRRSKTETGNFCKSSLSLDEPSGEGFCVIREITNSAASQNGLAHCSLAVDSPLPGYKYKWKSQFHHPFWWKIVPKSCDPKLTSVKLMHIWPYFNT